MKISAADTPKFKIFKRLFPPFSSRKFSKKMASQQPLFRLLDNNDMLFAEFEKVQPDRGMKMGKINKRGVERKRKMLAYENPNVSREQA